MIDRAHTQLTDLLWQSTERIERWFDAPIDRSEYASAFASLSAADVWDSHYGMRAPLRFDVSLPLSPNNRGLRAFVSHLNTDEYVSEKVEPSGAFKRGAEPAGADETLLGLAYQQSPRTGLASGVSAGIRLRLPLDPYVKATTSYAIGQPQGLLANFTETAFWLRDQGLGSTSRADVGRVWSNSWMVRYTFSATFSQSTVGTALWSSLYIVHSLSPRQSIAAEIAIDGQTDSAVPLHNLGLVLAHRAAFRKRPWIVLEIRAGLSWPKDAPAMVRHADPSLGLGLEILLGRARFLTRPITF